MRGPRKRSLLLFLMFGGGALVLLLVLCIGGICLYLPWESGRWDLLPSMLGSVWENGWSGRLRPVTEPPPAQTPALDSTPAPGIRLTAPAGALDRPRQFRATRLSERQLTALVRAAPDSIIAPLAGYDIDAGMSQDDLFAGQVKLAFDLRRLDIPQALWGSVSVARLAPDGTFQHLVTNREGATVSCQIRHNNPYLLLVMILGLNALYATDQIEKGALRDTLGCDVDPYFRVEWPRSLPLRQTPERDALNQQLSDLWNIYKPPAAQSDDPRIVSQRFWLFRADRRVQKLYATFADIEWKKKNFLPVKVAYVVDSFQKAGKYIFEVRGFRKRGERIELHCLTPWTGNPETFGYSKDGHFTYPYIDINLDRVPSDERAAGAQDGLDNLRVTAVHELFHVCQKEYYNWTKYVNPGQVWGGGVNHWFMEATALVLEEDARHYYLGNNWSVQFPLTADTLYGPQSTDPAANRVKLQGYFKVPMDSGGTESESAHRGYAASQFLLALRQSYYSRNPEAFLPAVLEAFGTFRSGPIDALVKATSGSEKIFGADYMVFCALRAANILNNVPLTVEQSLNPADPMIVWPLAGPVSSPCLVARIRGLGGPDLQRTKVLIRANSIREIGQLRRQEASGDFRTITSPSLLLTRADMGTRASDVLVTLQRIEPYISSEPESSIGESRARMSELAQTEVLLLAPPREAPKIQFDDERQVVRVEIPPSSLRNAGQVRDYRVTLYRIGNGRPLTFTTEGKSEVEIAWRQIAEAEPPTFSFLPFSVGDFTPQELLDMADVAQYVATRQAKGGPKLQLSYHEVVSESSRLNTLFSESRDIDGPESQIFEVPVEGFQLPGVRYDVSGNWSGKVWVVRIPLSANLSQSGDKITGTCSWGTDVYRVAGTWSPKEDAWETTLWVKQGETEMPALGTFYLRALPGEKLWLGAPPCILRPEKPKSEKKGGWSSWFKW